MKEVEVAKQFKDHNKAEDGWHASTRCQFCSDFYDKARAWICPTCWEAIQRIVLHYADEFRELLENAPHDEVCCEKENR